MERLSPAYFFDLSLFVHKQVFDNCRYVWMALDNLTPYLTEQQLGRIEGSVDERAYLINPEQISIGKNSVVEPGAYIKGPCMIGENCTVRHGAYIRGNLITGNGCVIGHDTEIKNAILLNQAHAAHFAYVGDSILGNQVNLGAGTICANLKLDNQPVTIRIEGAKVNTKRRKLGAIIGDGVQTGCHTVLNPGTLLGPGARSYPCINLGGFVPSGQTVKNL